MGEAEAPHAQAAAAASASRGAFATRGRPPRRRGGGGERGGGWGDRAARERGPSGAEAEQPQGDASLASASQPSAGAARGGGGRLRGGEAAAARAADDDEAAAACTTARAAECASDEENSSADEGQGAAATLSPRRWPPHSRAKGDAAAAAIDALAPKHECILCYETSPCVAVGPCQHIFCWLCALRLRLFPPYNPVCPFCKVSTPYLLLLYLPSLVPATLGRFAARLAQNSLPAVLAQSFLSPPFFTEAAALALPSHLRDAGSAFCFSSPAVRRLTEVVLQFRCWVPACRAAWLQDFVFCEDQDALEAEMCEALAARQKLPSKDGGEKKGRRNSVSERDARGGVGAGGGGSGNSASAGSRGGAAPETPTFAFPEPTYAPGGGGQTSAGAFSSLQQLGVHTQKWHGGDSYCSVCVAGRPQLLLLEHCLYPADLLNVHLQQNASGGGKASGRAAESQVYVHPRCRVCKERCLDGDALLLHVKNNHFHCALCEADVVKANAEAQERLADRQAGDRRGGGGARGENEGRRRRDADGSGQTEIADLIPVFSTLPQLQQHYRELHHPCPHTESCPLTVFRDETELLLHLATRHGTPSAVLSSRLYGSSSSSASAARASAGEPAPSGGSQRVAVPLALCFNYRTYKQEQQGRQTQGGAADRRRGRQNNAGATRGASPLRTHTSPRDRSAEPASASARRRREEKGARGRRRSPDVGRDGDEEGKRVFEEDEPRETEEEEEERDDEACDRGRRPFASPSPPPGLTGSSARNGVPLLPPGLASPQQLAAEASSPADSATSASVLLECLCCALSLRQKEELADDLNTAYAYALATWSADALRSDEEAKGYLNRASRCIDSLTIPHQQQQVRDALRLLREAEKAHAASAGAAEDAARRPQDRTSLLTQTVAVYVARLVAALWGFPSSADSARQARNAGDSTRAIVLPTLVSQQAASSSSLRGARSTVPPPQSFAARLLLLLVLGVAAPSSAAHAAGGGRGDPAGSEQRQQMLLEGLKAAHDAVASCVSAALEPNAPQETAGSCADGASLASWRDRGGASEKAQDAADANGLLARRRGKGEEEEAQKGQGSTKKENEESQKPRRAACPPVRSFLPLWEEDRGAIVFGQENNFLQALSWIVEKLDAHLGVDADDEAEAKVERVSLGVPQQLRKGGKHLGARLPQNRLNASRGPAWTAEPASKAAKQKTSEKDRKTCEIAETEAALCDAVALRSQLELQQLALLSRDLAPFIQSTKLLEDIQALGPTYYRLRGSSAREGAVTQWLARCQAALGPAQDAEIRTLLLYLRAAAAQRPEREQLDEFPSLPPSSASSAAGCAGARHSAAPAGHGPSSGNWVRPGAGARFDARGRAADFPALPSSSAPAAGNGGRARNLWGEPDSRLIPRPVCASPAATPQGPSSSSAPQSAASSGSPSSAAAYPPLPSLRKPASARGESAQKETGTRRDRPGASAWSRRDEEGPGRGAQEGEDSDRVACPACTYANNAMRASCQLCGHALSGKKGSKPKKTLLHFG
ncbi:hypothetical protein BESB_024920 [Besnoitia besnoiti]|uniref:RING-type domain-containing protein n=1 Tax=Besnoitia besnoiti TaxID=94643 RepID=A0A2A9M6L3_BESBE|nr:uncharacterized protein BESB_024920 [Besnoitia besnoiti]PFH31526.1 hypothetical protein BESB_024920 [Besnoitia besnoiti]